MDVRSLGFTTNASFRGIGISATSVHPAGTLLHLEMKLPGDKFCKATGVGAWSMRGMVALQVPGTMGIRIASADESFFQLLADNTPDEPVKPAARPAAPTATSVATVRRAPAPAPAASRP